MSTILDTVVVAFGEDVSSDEDFYSYKVLDDYLNDGKTSFNPGDDVNIMCQLKPGWIIQKITFTSGDVVSNGIKSRTNKMEKIFFTDVDSEMFLNFYPSGGISGSFYGNECTFLTGDDRLVVPSSAPVIADLYYSYSGYSLTIHTPSVSLGEDDSWPIGIVIWVVKG